MKFRVSDHRVPQIPESGGVPPTSYVRSLALQQPDEEVKLRGAVLVCYGNERTGLEDKRVRSETG